MSLADLIRKRPGNSATAISAIPATQPANKDATVARIATVAAANPPNAANDVPDILSDPAADSRRHRVLAMLANDPALRLAVVCDGQGDPVPVTVAIRVGTCEVLIPAARFDPLAILDLVERHTRTNVTRISPPEQIKGLEMMI